MLTGFLLISAIANSKFHILLAIAPNKRNPVNMHCFLAPALWVISGITIYLFSHTSSRQPETQVSAQKQTNCDLSTAPCALAAGSWNPTIPLACTYTFCLSRSRLPAAYFPPPGGQRPRKAYVVPVRQHSCGRPHAHTEKTYLSLGVESGCPNTCSQPTLAFGVPTFSWISRLSTCSCEAHVSYWNKKQVNPKHNLL